jgi:hypothetical protein
MDQDKIYNSTITIEEVIDKGKKLSIKGNDGNRTYTYSVWKTKQVKDDQKLPVTDANGQPVLTDSSAYAQYKTMGLGTGSTVMVGYVIDEYDAEINGMSKRVQSKKIIGFREAGTQSGQTAIAGRGEAPTRSQGHSTNAFGRRLGVQGHINALLSNPSFYSDKPEITIADLVKEAIAIEDEAEKQLNPSALREAVQRHAPKVILPDEELPVIQQDELDVSDIPF